jgi:DNA-binding NtrC family response regulator
MPGQSSILVVDDIPLYNNLYRQALQAAGYHVKGAFTIAQALTALEHHHVGLVLLDMLIPLPPWDIQEENTGLHLLKRIKAHDPKIQVIVVTQLTTPKIEMEAMKLGALEFFTKPVDLQRLLDKVQKVIPVARPSVLKTEPWYIYESPAMAHAVESAWIWATSNQPILITGEPGTGRQTLAQIIHNNTPKMGTKKCIAIDCSKLDVDLQPLVGNAALPRSGACAEVGSGTLVLSNIQHLSTKAQLKIEQLIHDRHYIPVGAGKPKVCQARIIATAINDLQPLMETAKFWDVLYQAFGLVINLPPLRQRQSDIKKIVVRMLQHKKIAIDISPAALELLERYDYQEANISELELILNYAAGRAANGKIEVKHLPQYIRSAQPKQDGADDHSVRCAQLVELLAMHRKRLYHYETQEAGVGAMITPSVLLEIEKCKDQIAKYEQEQRELSCLDTDLSQS